MKKGFKGKLFLLFTGALVLSISVGAATWITNDKKASTGITAKGDPSIACYTANNTTGDPIAYYTSVGAAIYDCANNSDADHIVVIPSENDIYITHPSGENYTLTLAAADILYLPKVFSGTYDPSDSEYRYNPFTSTAASDGTTTYEATPIYSYSTEAPSRADQLSTAASSSCVLKAKLGSNLSVNGTIKIGAVKNFATQGYQGYVTGDHATFDIAGKTMTVQSGASVECYGKITDSSYGTSPGLIDIKSGGSLDTNMCVDDFYGGVDIFAKYYQSQTPFNLYRIPYLGAKTRLNNGGLLNAICVLYVGKTGNYGDLGTPNMKMTMPLLGEGGLIEFSGPGGYIDHFPSSCAFTDEANYKETLEIRSADAATNAITLYASLIVYTLPMSMHEIYFPVNKFLDIGFYNSKLTVTTYLKILPGCEITFRGTSTVSFGYAEEIITSSVTDEDGNLTYQDAAYYHYSRFITYDVMPETDRDGADMPLYTEYYPTDSNGNKAVYDPGIIRFYDSSKIISPTLKREDQVVEGETDAIYVSGNFVFENGSTGFADSINAVSSSPYIYGYTETVEKAFEGANVDPLDALTGNIEIESIHYSDPYNVDLEIDLLIENGQAVSEFTKDNDFSILKTYNYDSEKEALSWVSTKVMNFDSGGTIAESDSESGVWTIHYASSEDATTADGSTVTTKTTSSGDFGNGSIAFEVEETDSEGNVTGNSVYAYIGNYYMKTTYDESGKYYYYGDKDYVKYESDGIEMFARGTYDDGILTGDDGCMYISLSESSNIYTQLSLNETTHCHEAGDRLFVKYADAGSIKYMSGTYDESTGLFTGDDGAFYLFDEGRTQYYTNSKGEQATSTNGPDFVKNIPYTRFNSLYGTSYTSDAELKAAELWLRADGNADSNTRIGNYVLENQRVIVWLHSSANAFFGQCDGYFYIDPTEEKYKFTWGVWFDSAKYCMFYLQAAQNAHLYAESSTALSNVTWTHLKAYVMSESGLSFDVMQENEGSPTYAINSYTKFDSDYQLLNTTSKGSDSYYAYIKDEAYYVAANSFDSSGRWINSFETADALGNPLYLKVCLIQDDASSDPYFYSFYTSDQDALAADASDGANDFRFTINGTEYLFQANGTTKDVKTDQTMYVYSTPTVVTA